MEYQNYFIEYKQIDLNLFVKFTDKNSKLSYENIIGPEQIDNLPINKFIKILENCIKKTTNYNIIIENEDNQLILFFNYDNEIINLSYTIQLHKSSTKTNDNLLKRIEQLEKIVDENNKINIAKIINLETYNYKMTNITNEYLIYSPKTEYIEVILPEDKYDITTDKRNNYDINFNYGIDPIQIFTNLKKIKLNDWKYLSYFLSICKCIYTKNTQKNCDGRDVSTAGVYEYYYNNTIEEIEIINPCGISYLGYQNTINDVCKKSYNNNMYDFYINISKLYHNYNKEVENNYNKVGGVCGEIILHLPKLNKIKINIIKSGRYFDLILNIIKDSINLKSLIINKIDFSDKKFT